MSLPNERYKILRALYEAAYRGYGSGLLYILSPPGRGKTHTRDILRRECTKCKLVPSATEAGLYEFFTKNAADCMFIMDDKTEWMKDDFGNGISYLKMAGTGRFKRLRMSKFTIEDTETPMMCIGVLCLNPDQANSLSFRLRETGFSERALKLRVSHTKEQYQHIKEIYVKHGFNRNRLPKLYIEPEFWSTTPGTVAPDVDAWILDNFNNESGDTVRLLAKVVSVEGFNSLKQCLLSGVTEIEFKEDIEFEVE